MCPYIASQPQNISPFAWCSLYFLQILTHQPSNQSKAISYGQQYSFHIQQTTANQRHISLLAKKRNLPEFAAPFDPPLQIIIQYHIIYFVVMPGEKVVPPKPEGLRKKEERDGKIAAALKQLREQRRAQNKQTRALALQKAQQYEAEYNAANQAEITARRQAKLTGQIHVPAQPKLAFVVRIRGINKLNPKVLRILRLLRLRQIHNGVFVRINKASSNLLRRVEPYITFGYPSRENIRKLILKRGYGKVNKQRIPLSDNQIVSETLGKQGVQTVEDLIHEIHTVGPHFKEANNFIWPFKLQAPRGGFAAKRHPFQRRGDWGNREEYINQLISQML